MLEIIVGGVVVLIGVLFGFAMGSSRPKAESDDDTYSEAMGKAQNVLEGYTDPVSADAMITALLRKGIIFREKKQ